MNPLEASGKPLFFKLAHGGATRVVPPSRPGMVVLRTVARALAGMQKEALVASSETGETWRLASDEGVYLMGDDVAPCPLAFMTTGMLQSFTGEIFDLAGQRGIPLPGLRITQDNYYTMEGSALKGTMIGGALPVDLSMEVDSTEDHDALEALLGDAVAASPVSALLANSLPSRFTLTHNGREVETRRVAALGRPPEPLPTDFDQVQPSEGDWNDLVRRNGMSPKTSEVTSSTGSSYAAEQSRRLHLQGISTLGPGGLMSIEQRLFNPHGSIFHFIGDFQSGKTGRAPDALTTLSAGIAFCFLTQFGRYAKIVHKDLEGYSIIQDTYFRLAHDGAPSTASAVETHVHLESGEDDEFARDILDMAEQTCFLHALCRGQVPVNARVTVRA